MLYNKPQKENKMKVTINAEMKKHVVSTINALSKDIQTLGTIAKATAQDIAIVQQQTAEKVATVKLAARLVDDLLKLAAGGRPSTALLSSGLITLANTEEPAKTKKAKPSAEVKKSSGRKSAKKSEGSTAKRAKTTGTKKSPKVDSTKAASV